MKITVWSVLWVRRSFIWVQLHQLLLRKNTIYCLKQVCVQPPLSALSMTLPAFAGACSTAPAAIDRYLLHTPALSSKLTGRRCCCRSMEQTNGRTDARPLHRPCSAYYAGGVSNSYGKYWLPWDREIRVLWQYCYFLRFHCHILSSAARIPCSLDASWRVDIDRTASFISSQKALRWLRFYKLSGAFEKINFDRISVPSQLRVGRPRHPVDRRQRLSSWNLSLSWLI